MPTRLEIIRYPGELGTQIVESNVHLRLPDREVYEGPYSDPRLNNQTFSLRSMIIQLCTL